MPNKMRRDKKRRSASARSMGQTSRTTGDAQKADSVKALLSRASPVLTSIREQRSRQVGWREWLAQRLPEALLPHVTGVVERQGELVIFTTSASWGVRIRYAMAELEPPPAIDRIHVRVMPGRGPG